MKDQIAQELKDQFAKGNLKPSQLKKSKSLNDLPATNTPVNNQSRRKSVDLLSQPASLKAQLAQAQDQISILELKLETNQRELTELNNLTKENAQLKTQLTNLKQALDHSFQARHQGLKVFQQEHAKRVQSERELVENTQQATEELFNQEQEIITLKAQVAKLKQVRDSLAQDLNLSQRLIELKSNEPYLEEPNLNYFKYGVYALLAIWFCLMLKRRKYD